MSDAHILCVAEGRCSLPPRVEVGGGTLAAAAAQVGAQPLLWAGAAALALSAAGRPLPPAVRPPPGCIMLPHGSP